MAGDPNTTQKIPALASPSAPAPTLVNEDAFRWPSDPLARGGMAVVYEGEDKRLHRKVILKSPREDVPLPPELDGQLAARVEAESRVLARLQHPSIVTIYELGRATTGTPFCVLEKVEGRSLRAHLDDLEEAEADGFKRTRERLELVSELLAIAEALAYAHERGVVHRDVTPNNILLGARGEATLIDWGLAKDIGAAEVAGLFGQENAEGTISAGTPPYVSLEQTLGKPADPSYDVYSFGIVLYEVVSGRTPFRWEPADDTEAAQKRMRKFGLWLSQANPIPPAAPGDAELSGIIAKAIARDAGDRFTADELVRALKQYLTGDLVFSHRYSLTGRIGRWIRRRRAVAVSLAGLVIALVVAAIAFLALRAESWRHARDKAELQADAAQQALENAQLEAANRETQTRNAELSALAAAARLDAAEKARRAEVAAKAAAAAEDAAAQAKRRGEDAETLRAEAEKQRALALEAEAAAQSAAKEAQGDASDAEKRWKQAIEARDAAETARDAAEAELAKARTAREVAEQAAATAKEARESAEAARDRAETDRRSAEEARNRAEQKISALEARIRELESRGGGGGGDGGGGGTGGGGDTGGGTGGDSGGGGGGGDTHGGAGGGGGGGGDEPVTTP
jgi:tRNA A-37 threonylcarbamoyl transferase component Bud32